MKRFFLLLSGVVIALLVFFHIRNRKNARDFGIDSDNFDWSDPDSNFLNDGDSSDSNPDDWYGDTQPKSDAFSCPNKDAYTKNFKFLDEDDFEFSDEDNFADSESSDMFGDTKSKFSNDAFSGADYA